MNKGTNASGRRWSDREDRHGTSPWPSRLEKAPKGFNCAEAKCKKARARRRQRSQRRRWPVVTRHARARTRNRLLIERTVVLMKKGRALHALFFGIEWAAQLQRSSHRLLCDSCQARVRHDYPPHNAREESIVLGNDVSTCAVAQVYQRLHGEAHTFWLDALKKTQNTAPQGY